MPGNQEGLARPWLCPCVLQVTHAGPESVSSAPAITCVHICVHVCVGGKRPESFHWKIKFIG